MNRVLLSKQYCYHRCVTKAYCVRFYVLKKKYDFLINDFLFLPNEPKSLSLSVFNFYFQWFSCGKQQTRNEYILFQIILTKSVRTQQKKKKTKRKQSERMANNTHVILTLIFSGSRFSNTLLVASDFTAQTTKSSRMIGSNNHIPYELKRYRNIILLSNSS